MKNAIIIDDKDNVAVVVEPINKGQVISYSTEDGTVKSLTALEDITVYHKVAIKDIPVDAPIIKYGEHIGVASEDIKVGMHVHVNNVKSVRENL